MSNSDAGDFGRTELDAHERAEAVVNLDEPSAGADEPWSPPDRQPRGAEMAEVEDETLGMRLAQEEPEETEADEPTDMIGGDDPDAIPADADVLGGDAEDQVDGLDESDVTGDSGPEADAMHVE